jgi:hypothetical protein
MNHRKTLDTKKTKVKISDTEKNDVKIPETSCCKSGENTIEAERNDRSAAAPALKFMMLPETVQIIAVEPVMKYSFRSVISLCRFFGTRIHCRKQDERFPV